MLSLRISCWVWGSHAAIEDLMMSLRISCLVWGSHVVIEDLMMSLRISWWAWGSHAEFEDLMLQSKISCWDWLRSKSIRTQSCFAGQGIYNIYVNVNVYIKASFCKRNGEKHETSLPLWPKQTAPGIWGHQCQLDDNLVGQLTNQTLHKVPTLWATVFVCSFFVFMIFGEDKTWSHYRIDPSFASWTFIVIVHQPSTQCKLGATFLDNFCTFLHPTTFSEISTSDLDKNVKTSIASTNWEWNP